MIPTEHKHRFAYHFTLIENLDSILTEGILSTNKKNKENILHNDIANQEIQLRRSKMTVTKGPGGVVHDYVPLYFAKRTPMLLSLIKSKNIDQIDVVYLAIKIDRILDDDVVFSDASANTVIPPNFYAKPKSLSKLYWPIIDSWDWTYSEEHGEKNKKMAEMLIHEKIKITDISHIVVWNNTYKEHVEEKLEELDIKNITVVTDYYRHFRYHYFCPIDQAKRTNLITGPRQLKSLMARYIKSTIEGKSEHTKFDSLEEAIIEIQKDFKCIQELADIDGLKTDNPIHKEDVGAHSRSVAARVQSDDKFDSFTKEEQNCLILAAYLHDIGKGPKSRWKDEIQKVDEDHSKKSLPMLKRIFSEDIDGWTKKQLRDIFILVIYDDLIGDIVANGRHTKQLTNIAKTKKQVDLLIALGKADMGAIKEKWVTNNLDAIENLRQQAYEEIESKDD